MTALTLPARQESVEPRAQELFDENFRENAARTDRMFAVLMIVQWLAGIAAALLLSPTAWNGPESYVHPHVWLALTLGAALASLPVYLAWRHPGQVVTRHVIAVAQVMFSSLLIHVSGGRIETHFHVFGSLAFLAFYRDWSVLVPATLVVAADHFVRGVFWPETVFGISSPAPWRWVEHAGWVIYEDFFLLLSCRGGVQEMWTQALRTSELEHTNREVQQQTCELEAAYRSKDAIVETALDAVICTTADGRITSWNTRAESMFGWPSDAVVGRPLADVVLPAGSSDGGTLRAHWEGAECGPAGRRFELTAIRADGTAFPVELAMAQIRGAGSLGYCAFVRDITLQQQAAESLRTAKEAAESASHAKSAFLANMSHEIRTPLNAILGFTHLLRDDLEGDSDQRRCHLQTIHDSGRHLLTLINDVLDLSKIEAGQMEVEPVRCSVHEIIAATISILRVRAEERSLSLEYFWKSEVPETIVTDPNRLRQVLMNLVGNAIKFTEVGSVQVAARITQGECPRLIVDVIDTGIGIEPAAAERIFDPFVQADASITRRFGGSGLGLSISRRLARLLGGELSVNSELGRGSIFTLTLPIGSLEGVALGCPSSADLTRPMPAQAAPAPVRLPPCRILLVEDGAANRKLVRLVLERAGASVQCAENGQEGVEAAAASTFDLILMDMQMPVMDGCTATRMLRRMGCQTPIFALTAHAMASDERECREAGCTGYLTKPIDPQRLLAAAAEALETAPRAASELSEEGDARFRIAPEPLPVAGWKEAVSSITPLQSSLPIEDPEFREIVEEFIVELEAQVAALHAACEVDDLARVEELAHWIKGAAGTAGFDAFTEPASALERAAKLSQTGQIAPSLARIDSLLVRIAVPVR